MNRAADERRATLVLGVGNPLLGDDGLGVRAVEMLAEHDLPPDVRVEDVGAPGWGLAASLVEDSIRGKGWSRVIIVDAAHMGQMPGAWRRFGPTEVTLVPRIAAGDVLSLHDPDLASGLALAQALDMLPEEIVIYGIEPACADAGQDLSLAVKRALPGVVESILAELWERKE